MPAPFDAWLILRGIRTLPWRMRAHCANAHAVAGFLSGHPGVERVHYPGLPGDPGHALAAKQMTDAGGMLSLVVPGGRARASRWRPACACFTRATSLGGPESLVEHRASIEGERTRAPEGLLRLSVGLEHAEDLVADLAQALEHERRPSGDALWPGLPLEAWSDTCATLHLWTQIVGKIRLTQTPWMNHSWHVTLYVTAARAHDLAHSRTGRGPSRSTFDFVAHQLRIRTSDGAHGRVPLEPQSVATFYRAAHGGADGARPPRGDPREAERGRGRRSRSPRTRSTAPTIADYANRFWRVLVQADRVFKRSAPASSGSAAPCTSSGARPTWPSRASPGGRPRRIRAASPTCPTASPARPTRTR